MKLTVLREWVLLFLSSPNSSYLKFFFFIFFSFLGKWLFKFEPSFLQVFMFSSSDMLSVDVLWCVCYWNTLSDSFFCVILVNLSWLLHYVWASISNRAPLYSCTWVCLLLDSCWVQSFCTLLHSEFLIYSIH